MLYTCTVVDTMRYLFNSGIRLIFCRYFDRHPAMDLSFQVHRLKLNTGRSNTLCRSNKLHPHSPAILNGQKWYSKYDQIRNIYRHWIRTDNIQLDKIIIKRVKATDFIPMRMNYANVVIYQIKV